MLTKNYHRVIFGICLLVLGITLTVSFAQVTDEDAEIVAEELAIDDVLDGDLLGEEISLEGLDDDLGLDIDVEMFDGDPVVDDVFLDEVVEEDPADEPGLDDALAAEAPAEELSGLEDLVVEDAAPLDSDFDGGLEAEAVATETLDVDLLGADDPGGLEPEGTALEGLIVEDIAEEVVPAIEAADDDDLLSGLEVEDSPLELDLDDAAPLDMDTEGDDLLEALAVEDVSLDADSGLDIDREVFDGVGAGQLEKGVPADLLAEEAAVDALSGDQLESDMESIDALVGAEGADQFRDMINEMADDLAVASPEEAAALMESKTAEFEALALEMFEADAPSAEAGIDALPVAATDLSDDESPAPESMEATPAAEDAPPARIVMPASFKGVAAEPGAVVDDEAESVLSGLNEEQRVKVMLMREAEELRRLAYKQHADDRIAAAEGKYDLGEYNEAIRIYEEARNALDALGALPDVAERLELIRARIATCKYQRASVLTRYGDYDSAIRLAREASLEGHPKAPKLVDIIQKRIDGPQEVIQAPEPRWRSSDFKDMRRTIRDRLRQGRDFYVAQEFDKALDTFESVLFIDPQNTEAIRWREKTVQVIHDRARMELESTRRDMMATVSRTWNPRDYGASEFADTGPTKGESPTPSSGPALQRREILEKMRRIKIPEIDFRETNIHDVIGFLTESSVDYDDDDVPDEHKGINIILNISDSDSMDAAPVEESFLFDSDSADTGMGVPTITFRARGISLLEALDLTTQIGGLKYRVQGSVVMVIPVDDPGGEIVHRTYSVLPTVGEVISNLSQDFGGRGGGGGDFITLENEGIGGDATDWQEFFRQMGVDWPRGSSIKYIQSIGKLLVANTVENLTTFEEKLAALNVVPSQIEIEARFVEIAQTDLNSFGLEYRLTDDWEIAQKQESGPLGSRERIVMKRNYFTKGNRFLTEIVGAADATFGRSDDILRVASVLTNPELEIILHALQEKGNADLLSAPKVTTQSGSEATIKVVTEYIYPSDYTIEPGTPATLNADGSVQTPGQPPVVTPASFETREVGVILAVLPEVTPEGQMINLTLTPEVVTEPDWRDYGQEFTDATGQILRIPIEQPFFHTRSISTSIMIYNSATVVMGGMISEARTEVDDRIPFLGDLPIIGRLFRSTYENSEKRNLLIFVTARLVDPAGRPVGETDELIDAISQSSSGSGE